jgi:hypothetical protein
MGLRWRCGLAPSGPGKDSKRLALAPERRGELLRLHPQRLPQPLRGCHLRLYPIPTNPPPDLQRIGHGQRHSHPPVRQVAQLLRRVPHNRSRM